MSSISEFNLLHSNRSEELLKIMNIFLDASENLNMQLSPEYVLDKLERESEYGYTMDNLNKDLKYLCSINDLKCQDENPFGIHTLEAYKNRKKYYAITKAGIAVTRAINDFMSEKRPTRIKIEIYFERIEKSLAEVEKIEDQDKKESWWDIFSGDCSILFQSYQDYINTFDTEEFEELSNKKEFVEYKNLFIMELNQMVSDLGKNARKIIRLIMKKNQIIDKLLKEILENNKKNTFNIFGKRTDKEWVKWDNIQKWFLYIDGEQPAYMNILDYSTNIISRMVKKSIALSSLDSNAVKNKILLSDMEDFYNCEFLEEAEKIYVDKYGTERIFHIQSDYLDNNLNTDFGDGDVLRYEFDPIRRKKRKKLKSKFANREMEKDLTALDILKHQEQLEKNLLSYKKNEHLKISEIKEEISQQEMEMLLRWIGKGLSGNGQTETGKRFSLKRSDEEIYLQSESGQLSIENFELIFGE